MKDLPFQYPASMSRETEWSTVTELTLGTKKVLSEDERLWHEHTVINGLTLCEGK
jgi:hypothetical protein